jgi:hypothetical protein
VIFFPPPRRTIDVGDKNVKRDGFYHTVFGPACAHSGVVYGENDTNLSAAFTRLTKSRVPLLPGYEQFLQLRQVEFINTHAEVIARYGTFIEAGFSEYIDMVSEAQEHHDDPHQKKELRIAAWSDLLQCNLLFDRVWFQEGGQIKYKMKKHEIAKPKKVPRVIGDLGVHASLQGFRLCNFWKHAMSAHPFEYLGGTIECCPKPDPHALELIFEKLIDPPGRFYFVCFSDDSCLAIRTPAGVLRFNMDIKSCDGSHTGLLWDVGKRTIPSYARDDFQRLIDQCTEPITVRSIENRRNKIKLRPKYPRLYSGTTCTTGMNQVANFLIAVSIAESVITQPEDILAAARAVGYLISLEDCSDWHSLQFLKHSPVLDVNEHLRPVLNLGVLLRLSGTAKGDVPGGRNDTLHTRFTRFQSALIRGAYPRTNCRLLDNMRRNFSQRDSACEKIVSGMMEHKVSESDYPTFTVHSHELFQRYALTPLEISEVEDGFGNCLVGDHYHSSGTDKILLADYGLRGRELDTPDVTSPAVPPLRHELV